MCVAMSMSHDYKEGIMEKTLSVESVEGMVKDFRDSLLSYIENFTGKLDDDDRVFFAIRYNDNKETSYDGECHYALVEKDSVLIFNKYEEYVSLTAVSSVDCLIKVCNAIEKYKKDFSIAPMEGKVSYIVDAKTEKNVEFLFKRYPFKLIGYLDEFIESYKDELAIVLASRIRDQLGIYITPEELLMRYYDNIDFAVREKVEKEIENIFENNPKEFKDWLYSIARGYVEFFTENLQLKQSTGDYEKDLLFCINDIAYDTVRALEDYHLPISFDGMFNATVKCIEEMFKGYIKSTLYNRGLLKCS